MSPRCSAFLLSTLLAAPAFGQTAVQDDGGPFRLHEALGLPDWLTLRIEQRTRYESLDEEFRAGGTGSNQLFALRTLGYVAADIDRFRVVGELIDARVYDGPADGFLNTTLVNPLELLQGHLAYRDEDVFAEGDSYDVRLGRLTMDQGSRRLVARNGYRNTINSFTGIHGNYESAEGNFARAFYVLPIRRLPRDAESLRDNEPEFDEELDRTHFAGLYLGRQFDEDGLTGELYGFRLDEEDQGGVSTRDRRLWTVGTRWHTPAAVERPYFEWESVYQFGDSRASGSATEDLDHKAHFHHLSVGYRFEGESKLSLDALFDYASGDDDPTDGENNRFDTLFGGRRFELGPTSIFGPIARSNFYSPGVRVRFQPLEDTRVMLSHRLYYLASDRDAWTGGGLVDPTGATDPFLGQIAEIRVRHQLVPGNVRLEFGAAQLFAGDFLENAPGADGEDSLYGYVTTTFTF